MSDKHKISQDGNLPTLVVCCITTEGATKKSRSPTDERLASVFTKEANHRDDKPFALPWIWIPEVGAKAHQCTGKEWTWFITSGKKMNYGYVVVLNRLLWRARIFPQTAVKCTVNHVSSQWSDKWLWTVSMWLVLFISQVSKLDWMEAEQTFT